MKIPLRAGLILGLVATAMFASLVWPTRWRYEKINFGESRQTLLRIDRFSGDVDMLYPTRGWIPWTPR